MTERPAGLPTPFPADDDWSGVTNRDVRRRLQNRLNQRAYREIFALRFSGNPFTYYNYYYY